MNINVDIPKIFLPIFNSNKRNIVLYGGRGSGKSYIIAMLLVMKAIEKPNQIILCTREIQNSILDSVHSILVQSIERMGLTKLFDITDKKIECRNGSKFIFKGLYRNVQGIKSTEGISYAWIEEAATVSQDSIDLLWPTVRNEGSQIFVTFNPDQETDPVYSRFVKNKRDDTLLINANFTDNPFFPDVLKQEMLYDRAYNYDKYLWIWEGQCRNITDACIFKEKFQDKDFETNEKAHFFYGSDFGFSNDPSTIIRCYEKDRCLYIDYEAGGVGIEIDDLPNMYRQVPGVREHKIIADSSRPDTISYLNRQRFFVRGAKKGKDSIKDGIEFIRSFKMIFIHPRCKNTLFEFKSYSYKTDRLTGEILPDIVDKDNHWIDALRYALEDLRRATYKYRVLR